MKKKIVFLTGVGISAESGIPTSVSILESRFKSILCNCNIGA